MVHRILALVALVWTAALPEARAFCRTTTCSSRAPRAECGNPAQRDPITQCLVAGRPLFWREPCVSFSIQRDGSRALSLSYDVAAPILERAFNAWTSVSCGNGSPSISVTNLGPIECGRREFNPAGPNANVVVFRDDHWPHDSVVIGLTTVNFDHGSGEIFGADMEINTHRFPLSDSSLEFVVIHEAGHFFGIDHSPLDSAVMFAEYSSRGIEDPRHTPEELMLTEDDIGAMCAAYPPDRPVSPTCDPEPRRGYASDCGGNVYGSCAIRRASAGARASWAASTSLAIAAALLAARRRFRALVVRKLVPPRRV